jgi:hypothetical protein
MAIAWLDGNRNELILSKKAQQDRKIASKKDIYVQIGVSYYVVFDPLRQIAGEAEMRDALLRVWTIASGRYTELTSEPGIGQVGQPIWLETIGVGLTLWEGKFEEDVTRLWLRWCDRDGQVIPTGAERAATEQQRAERLAERLRAMGINPDEV